MNLFICCSESESWGEDLRINFLPFRLVVQLNFMMNCLETVESQIQHLNTMIKSLTDAVSEEKDITEKE